MKLEEITEFWLDWGSDQQLTVHEGLSVATDVLKAGPLPVQIGTRSTTYMALGPEVPGPWLALFQAAVDPTAFQVDTTFTARAERGVLVQTLSLAPCERGEHLHASVHQPGRAHRGHRDRRGCPLAARGVVARGG